MNYYVYRFKNNKDIIIYVGKTINLENRFKQHEHLTSDVEKIEYIECSSEAEMVWKEIYYINLYYNELSKNILDVYKNEKMQNIGLKDSWKEYTPFSNRLNKVMIDEFAIPHLNYKELITIIDHYKLNSIGDNMYALSEKWFKDNPYRVKQLKNNIFNYYMNIIKDKDKAEKCLWITYIQYYNNLKGKGYTKGFYYTKYNKSKYKDKIYLAYIENNFMNNNLQSNLTQDQYALTCILQFLFKSGLRDGKRITVYVPSKRMRNLLIDWIEAQKYEE